MLDPYAPPAADVDAAAEVSTGGALELADRGARLGAALLDALLYVVVALPGFIMMLSGGGGAWIIIPLLALAFYQWYLISSRGQSLAKGWLGIRIVKMDGSPCGFVNGVVLRVWVPSAIAYGVALVMGTSGIDLRVNPLAIVDALFIFGAQRRCLHDLIANTQVVQAQSGRARYHD